MNSSTPKDMFVIPITDMLIDSITKDELLSFMDGFFGYNQIQIAIKDLSMTTSVVQALLGHLNGWFYPLV